MMMLICSKHTKFSRASRQKHKAINIFFFWLSTFWTWHWHATGKMNFPEVMIYVTLLLLFLFQLSFLKETFKYRSF